MRHITSDTWWHFAACIRVEQKPQPTSVIERQINPLLAESDVNPLSVAEDVDASSVLLQLRRHRDHSFGFLNLVELQQN